MTIIGGLIHFIKPLLGIYWVKTIEQKEVPNSILNKFYSRYGIITKPNWKIRSGNYLANFKVEGSQTFVFYNPFGKLKKIITELYYLNNTNIPKNIDHVLMTKFSGFEINKTYIVTIGNKVTYSIHVGKQLEKIFLTFDQKGNIIISKRKNPFDA